jgi:tRNA 2-selenouridine synthase
MRQLLTRYLHEQVARTELRLISGPTGSWKTHLIDWIDQENHLAIDLEEHAAHRGSAFGKLGPQPAQINFEHAIVKDFLAHEEAINNKKPLYLEDESRTIGRCIIPDVLFLKMRESPILWLDEPIEARVENIYFDYIQCTDIARSSDLDRIQNVYKGFRDSLMGIKKRLGLEKYGEIYKDLLHSETQSLTRNDHDSNRIWIRKLLQYYYDPLYLGSLERRNPVTLIKARIDEVKAFITH